MAKPTVFVKFVLLAHKVVVYKKWLYFCDWKANLFLFDVQKIGPSVEDIVGRL